MPKPKPIHKLTVCDQCGLPWDEHTKGRTSDPTLDVCVRLLKAELSKRPATLPHPYAPPPYVPQPWTGAPYRPYIVPQTTPTIAPRLPQITCSTSGNPTNA